MIFVTEYSHAMEKDWHEDHFTCVKCEKPLKREKFVSVEGRPCCTQCYNNAVASVCDECGQAIGPGSKDIIVRDRHWHEDCFVCTTCSKKLVSTVIVSLVLTLDVVCNKSSCKLERCFMRSS